MQKISRHHHYLSQCYLRGFTKSGSKKSKLTVFDLNRNVVFISNTRNVGGIRDFDRIDIDGIDPDMINQQLSTFESQVALSLRNIERIMRFEGEDRTNILNLIALLAVRSPQRRESWRLFREQVIKKMLDMMLSSKEIWERTPPENDEEAIGSSSKISYEQAKAFNDSGNYKVRLSTEHHLKMEMLGIDTILPLLDDRKWILVKVSEDAGSFITTDNPVSLVWKYINKIPKYWMNSPGYGMKETQVQFPISKNLTLLGEFEGYEGVVEIEKEFVALLNSKMLINSHEQVYAVAEKGFSFVNFMVNDSELLNGSQLLSFVRRYKPT